MLNFLNRKYLLVDTCFVSALYRSRETKEDRFEPFLQQIKAEHCTLTINDFIYLEFIRIAKSQKEKEKIENFLKKHFDIIPITNEIIESKSVYPLYNFCNKGKDQISVTDVLNVAFLKKYGKNLFLITFDNNDYPLKILDRPITGTIDVETQILTYGIYYFNQTKFNHILKIFNRK